MFSGSVTSRPTQCAIENPATKLPRCGVAMKITRRTSGIGVTNNARRNVSRVSGESVRSSSGLVLSWSNSAEPEFTTTVLASNPPWL